MASRLEEKLDDEDIQGIKRFKYISIHASALLKDSDKKEWLRYPSRETEATIDKIIQIADITGAQTILFHPDLVDDFKWLNDKIGDRLALENMDERKFFGKTVGDLEKAFSLAPKAKWVCDVNHLYTLDKTIRLAEEFHQAFAHKLCHYHLSGYGGPQLHDLLYLTREDIILEGIKNFSAPIIHEGRALRDGKASLVKENEYILARLNNFLKNKLCHY